MERRLGSSAITSTHRKRTMVPMIGAIVTGVLGGYLLFRLVAPTYCPTFAGLSGPKVPVCIQADVLFGDYRYPADDPWIRGATYVGTSLVAPEMLDPNVPTGPLPGPPAPSGALIIAATTAGAVTAVSAARWLVKVRVPPQN